MFTTRRDPATSRLLVGVVRAIAAILLIGLPLVSADRAGEYARKARQARESGDLTRAYVYFAEAAALAPNNTEYWATSQALQAQALAAAQPVPADPVDEAAEASSVLGRITAEDLAAIDRLQPPVELAAEPGRQSSEIEGNGRELWEAVGAFYGLSVIFDSDYPPGSRRTLRIQDVDYRDAIHLVSTATNSFAVPVTKSLLLVATDTEQNRTELEPTMAVTIPLSDTVSAEEAQELAQAVQQTMEIQRLTVDTTRQLVLIRDRVSKVRPAQLLFEAMLRRRPEVVVEAEFLEVTESSSLRYGMDLQSSFPLVWLGDLKNVLTSIPTGVRFATFGGGASMIGIGIANAELFASMSRSSSRSILKSTLRSVDGQTATLHVGERFPVITSGYYGDVGSGDQVYRPPPTVSFEDLGVVLNVTPHVHGTEEISLDVEAEYRVLAGESVNGIPVIANRTFQSTVRIKNGEWALMSGLVRDSEMRSIAGIAGLSQLPVLGPLFRRNTSEDGSQQTLLVLRPRLVYHPAAELSTPAIWTGTESRLLDPL